MFSCLSFFFVVGKPLQKRSELNDKDHHKLGTEQGMTSTTDLPV
jgi:hypothetical protein